MGRPSIFAQFGEHAGEMERGMIGLSGLRSRRGAMGFYYQSSGVRLVTEAASEIQHADVYTDGENIFCKSILEQLGRMELQDGYSKEDCIIIANRAANAWHEGMKVKDIERYIRNGRLTGNW